MPKIDLRVNDIYIPHLKNYARTQILYGGSSSGKSHFEAQRCVLDLLGGKRNYLICRAFAKYSKKSTWVEIENVIETNGLEQYFNKRISDGVIECVTGCQAHFVGLDDPQKLKSIRARRGAITDIWVEEATETDRKSVKELYKRQRGGDPNVPKRMVLTFNPILRTSWIYAEHFNAIAWADDQTTYNDGSLSILKTTYKDNRFLTREDIDDLENETDDYYYQVYTLGNWGVLGNVIFTNWEVRDLSGMHDQFVNRRNGLDFGFSIDPAALVQTHYDAKRKTIYIFGEVYETGLTNDLLAEQVVEHIKRDRVACDSAEPKSIVELQRYGVQTYPVRKGRDSVYHGIQWLQQHKIIIDASCINTRNEFQQYKWKEDRLGNATKQPVDRNNHIIDALRYAYEDDMRGGWSRGY